MRPNEDLIREAIDQTSGKGKDAMRDRIAAYRTACRLSRGPDPKRSRYWAEKAKSFEDDIRRLTPRRNVPGRGLEQCA